MSPPLFLLRNHLFLKCIKPIPDTNGTGLTQ
nr:MAG TPA: hypothetical protein [Caudoviricetes sp.]